MAARKPRPPTTVHPSNAHIMQAEFPLQDHTVAAKAGPKALAIITGNARIPLTAP